MTANTAKTKSALTLTAPCVRTTAQLWMFQACADLKRGVMTMSEYIEQRESVLAEIENEYKNVDKIKTPFAKIIVDGTVEKPYYSILWLDKENKGYNVGYSSYCIDYVFKWLEVVFEIVAADESHAADVAPVRHARWVDNHCTACGMMPMGDEMWKHLDLEPPLFERFMDYCPSCGCRMDG